MENETKNLGTIAPKCAAYTSLVILICQTTALVLTIRYSRTSSMNETSYLTSTVVVVVEIAKVLASGAVIIIQKSIGIKSAKLEAKWHFYDTMKMIVPSLLYTIQNNLLYIALNNLDAVTYQATYQLKILTTALFSVLMLGRKLRKLQWAALILLIIGVALVQIPSSGDNRVPKPSAATRSQSQMVGLAAIIVACFSSGFSGVYLEKILKEAHHSLWTRNIQLGLFGILFSVCCVLLNDFSTVSRDGFFRGYNSLTWIIVVLQGFGGIMVAVVMKYADNILKGFALSISIVLSSIVSFAVLDEKKPSTEFFAGVAVVVMATVLYEYKPHADANEISKVPSGKPLLNAKESAESGNNRYN